MTPPSPAARPTPALGRVSTVDALVNALKQEIFAGRLPGGTALREIELSVHYGVSRHSVRVALQVLGQAGLAHQVANRSVQVATLTTGAVNDIYHMRSLIELEAVALLSERPELRGPAREALHRLAAMPRDTEWGVVRDLDLGFHAAIIESMGSERATRIFASLLDELRLAFLQIKGELHNAEQVIKEHQEIFELIESGDGDAARELVKDHLESTRATIAASLAEQ